jgi:hypothetical protein
VAYTLAGLAAMRVVRTMPVTLARPVWRGLLAGSRAAREGKAVRRISSSERARSWVVDYSAARARAIKWLGDRYLLAKPINASDSGWRKAPQTLFHPARVTAGAAERSA